ncbi:MAG: type II toxin-antitoxin system VapC family toxin [Planctomycetes bacterium]|nr:type II toxin-antitoxin system VapC family toxin [Planctomycetota bacterium]
MRAVFADTFYFLALLNNTDQGHQKAVDLTNRHVGRMTTTGWVLTELADALAWTQTGRNQFARTLEKLKADPNIQVIPCDDALFQDGVDLYVRRPDKEWSLTDCISFVVMTREGITNALTGDRHFEQAGFVALLK